MGHGSEMLPLNVLLHPAVVHRTRYAVPDIAFIIIIINGLFGMAARSWINHNHKHICKVPKAELQRHNTIQ